MCPKSERNRRYYSVVSVLARFIKIIYSLFNYKVLRMIL